MEEELTSIHVLHYKAKSVVSLKGVLQGLKNRGEISKNFHFEGISGEILTIKKG